MYATFISRLSISQRLYGASEKNNRRQAYKYDIGTWVRISKQWQTFSKGYLPSWSEDVTIQCSVSLYTLGNQTPVQRVISSVRAVYPHVIIVTLSVNGNGIILGM